jgi:hypothetical protein
LQWFNSIQPDSGKSVRCQGIAFNSTSNLVYIYLVGTATSLSFGTNYDNSILVFDNVGNLKNGKVITMGQDITYKFDNNYFIPYSNFTYFFFGGEIYGYNTSL